MIGALFRYPFHHRVKWLAWVALSLLLMYSYTQVYLYNRAGVTTPKSSATINKRDLLFVDIVDENVVLSTPSLLHRESLHRKLNPKADYLKPFLLTEPESKTRSISTLSTSYSDVAQDITRFGSSLRRTSKKFKPSSVVKHDIFTNRAVQKKILHEIKQFLMENRRYTTNYNFPIDFKEALFYANIKDILHWSDPSVKNSTNATSLSVYRLSTSDERNIPLLYNALYRTPPTNMSETIKVMIGQEAPTELKKTPNVRKPYYYGVRDDQVHRSAFPTRGEPWPRPRIYHSKNELSTILPKNFLINITNPLSDCDIISTAVKAYQVELEELYEHAQKHVNFPKKNVSVIPSLEVYIEDLDECGLPTSNMNENYTLVIENTTATLRSVEIWGALRGLETFIQLVHPSWNNTGQLFIRNANITDFPAFQHRGILLDTSRHFYPVPIIFQNLDAMAMHKFNVFHWHIVDHQSFPYQSLRFPNLSNKGAYSPEKVYTPSDIKKIIQYARLKGIRVVPEFDTPGHMRSWGFGQPDLLVNNCSHHDERYGGIINPIRNTTYAFLFEFFDEVRDLFLDEAVHLGSDEVSTECWYHDPEIYKYFEQGKHYNLLEEFFTRRQKLLEDIDVKWQKIMWEEVLLKYDMKHFEPNPNNTIYHIWLNENEGLTRAIQNGYRFLYSACWYLDHVAYDPDWIKYYDCNPLNKIRFSSLPEKRKKDYKEYFLGGEACMWSEYVDEHTMMQRLWPRAASPAERLWSNTDTYAGSPNVKGRFEENYCRMKRRGIPAGPTSGPGDCEGAMPWDRVVQYDTGQMPTYSSKDLEPPKPKPTSGASNYVSYNIKSQRNHKNIPRQNNTNIYNGNIGYHRNINNISNIYHKNLSNAALSNATNMQKYSYRNKTLRFNTYIYNLKDQHIVTNNKTLSNKHPQGGVVEHLYKYNASNKEFREQVNEKGYHDKKLDNKREYYNKQLGELKPKQYNPKDVHHQTPSDTLKGDHNAKLDPGVDPDDLLDDSRDPTNPDGMQYSDTGNDYAQPMYSYDNNKKHKMVRYTEDEPNYE